VSDHPTVTAWHHQQEPVDEQQFTPWADEGWASWNGQSPELAVCNFVQTLIGMMEPRTIVETGVGQGYMTRAIGGMLNENQTLLAYESSGHWRTTMWTLPFWTENRFNVALSPDPTPDIDALARADLCVFDSDFVYRFQEIELWNIHAKPGAVALIHDTGDQPQTIHASLRELIVNLGMTGVFLKNPRGCFMAVQGNKEE
jgi:hypothetical protein